MPPQNSLCGILTTQTAPRMTAKLRHTFGRIISDFLIPEIR